MGSLQNAVLQKPDSGKIRFFWAEWRILVLADGAQDNHQPNANHHDV